MNVFKKALLIMAITFAPYAAYAECTTQTYFIDGKVTICTVCCYGNNCTTTCY